jgi:hypothetical protein
VKQFSNKLARIQCRGRKVMVGHPKGA